MEAPNVLETLPMPGPLRCRNKAEYAIGGGKIGFMRAGSRELVPVCDCLLQQEASVRAIKQLSKMDLRGLLGAVTRVNRRGRGHAHALWHGQGAACPHFPLRRIPLLLR